MAPGARGPRDGKLGLFDLGAGGVHNPRAAGAHALLLLPGDAVGADEDPVVGQQFDGIAHAGHAFGFIEGQHLRIVDDGSQGADAPGAAVALADLGGFVQGRVQLLQGQAHAHAETRGFGADDIHIPISLRGN